MPLNVPKLKTLKVEAIKPYENNPRRIPAEAVEKVRQSLETYGYQQPIVVDQNDVVVVGHTRLEALKQMGVEEVQVYVTDLPEDKIREYRVIDNRTGEMSEWDHSALVMELREWEQSLMESFFPELDLEIGTISDTFKDVTEKDVATAEEAVKQVRSFESPATTTVICPSCYHSFEVKTASLPGLSQTDLEIIEAARAGQVKTGVKSGE